MTFLSIHFTVNYIIRISIEKKVLMLFSPSAKLSVCERVIISVLFPAKRFFVVKKGKHVSK